MGMGISIVTAICLTDTDRTRRAARSLAKYFPSRSYGVVVRKGKYLSQQARDFIGLIQPQMLAMRKYDETGHSGRRCLSRHVQTTGTRRVAVSAANPTVCKIGHGDVRCTHPTPRANVGTVAGSA
jgi:hypothetical protein